MKTYKERYEEKLEEIYKEREEYKKNREELYRKKEWWTKAEKIAQCSTMAGAGACIAGLNLALFEGIFLLYFISPLLLVAPLGAVLGCEKYKQIRRREIEELRDETPFWIWVGVEDD
ncbi:hypothetical protein [Paludifilum halophilum]|uniref:Uncharacterized protein n=1 Tax=Paludifilum halophilum TaxID=1642702 RepID=A0A235B8B7_9BACL|nr:hypothetical protein [Paludifilum halophilum]OYD08558.1 hypothetical protein CHM34_06955 [Paludifilum halophilum]